MPAIAFPFPSEEEMKGVNLDIEVKGAALDMRQFLILSQPSCINRLLSPNAFINTFRRMLIRSVGWNVFNWCEDAQR